MKSKVTLRASVAVGSNATVTVVASGTPPLSYQWRHNGDNIAGATQSSYTRSGAQFLHSGNYDVIVSNSCDEVTSQVALVTVTLLGGDQLKLVLAGEPGANVTIWRSEDLTNWIALTNIPNLSGAVEFVDPVSLDATQRFYRAQFNP